MGGADPLLALASSAMASSSTGGIPRLLYESVREPLLPDLHTQYGSPPVGSPGSVGGSSTGESRKRNFTAALNPRAESESDLEAREESPMEERRYLDVPHRYQGKGQRSNPAVDESGTMINVRSIENRSSEVPGKI